MKSNFKVGQTVYCVMCGEGVITHINKQEEVFPITVTFKDGRVCEYTVEGEYFAGAARMLFFTTPEVQGATEPVFEPQLKEGDKIVSLYKGESVIKEVVKENETTIEVRNPLDVAFGEYYLKNLKGLQLFKLGEEIKF